MKAYPIAFRARLMKILTPKASPTSIPFAPVPGEARSAAILSPSTITTGADPVPRTAIGPNALSAWHLGTLDQLAREDQVGRARRRLVMVEVAEGRNAVAARRVVGAPSRSPRRISVCTKYSCPAARVRAKRSERKRIPFGTVIV